MLRICTGYLKKKKISKLLKAVSLVIKGIQRRQMFFVNPQRIAALEIHKMLVGTRSSRVYGGKMAVKLGTMKDSEIQYAVFQHSAVGYRGSAPSTVHRVEMERKELDPLVMKRSCDERQMGCQKLLSRDI